MTLGSSAVYSAGRPRSSSSSRRAAARRGRRRPVWRCAATSNLSDALRERSAARASAAEAAARASPARNSTGCCAASARTWSATCAESLVHLGRWSAPGRCSTTSLAGETRGVFEVDPAAVARRACRARQAPLDGAAVAARARCRSADDRRRSSHTPRPIEAHVARTAGDLEAAREIVLAALEPDPAASGPLRLAAGLGWRAGRGRPRRRG